MSELRFGTVTGVASLPWTLADDLDPTTDIGIDVWAAAVAPAVNDRVLYQVAPGNQVVVLSNLSSPLRVFGVTLTMQSPVANTPDTQAVAFPAGLFISAPRVFGTVGTGTTDPSVTNTEISATAITTSGFNANFNRTNTTSCFVRWLAIGL